MTKAAKKKVTRNTKTQGKTVNVKVKKVKKQITGKNTNKVIKVKATKATKSTKASKTKSVTREKQTRLEVLQTLAENTNLPKVQIEKVFLELVKLIESHLTPKGSGEFSIPFTGIKIKRIKKKASKARKMFSPLIGEEVEIAGKSARNSVKVLALKTLKEMVEKK